MTATLLLWSGFFISLRSGAHSSLTTADIAILRFTLPALLLLPLVYRARSQLLAVPKRYLAGMFIGSGLPYLLVAATGMQYAPVADGSALIPGTLPVFVTAIAVLFYRQSLSNHKIIGLILVLAGIAAFLYTSLIQYQPNLLKGHLLFLLGSSMWAVFTISARVANLHALVSAGLVSLLSLAALIIAIFNNWVDSTLLVTPLISWPWQEVIAQLLLQGVGAGFLAAISFLYAVKNLGAERSAALASVTPVIATLLAIPLFGEWPTTNTWFALSLICFGSIIASQVLRGASHKDNYQPPSFHSGEAKKQAKITT